MPQVTALELLLRRDRAVVLASLAFVILLAWAYLLLGAGMERGSTMGMAPVWTPGYALLVFVMWAAMMAAMMLPSAAPVALLVAALARKRNTTGPARTALFMLGYLIIWLGFSIAATTLQWTLARASLLSEAMATSNTVLAGGILLAAGLYQWTPLKNACLRHCRSPLDFLLFHWRDGAWGALASGTRHGLFCLGCCWMLMAVLFVGGVMNVVLIAAIAFLVLIEKAMPWGGRMSRVTGAVLAAWGTLTLGGLL